MAEVTLADINQTLISVDENTQTTSRGIEGFLKYLEEKRRDDLEAERERKAQRVEVSKQKSDSAGKTSGGFKFPSLGLGGLGKGLGSLLTLGGALGLARALGSRLLKRGLLTALGVGLADTIANKLVTGNDQASAQLRTTLSNTISGAAIGGAIFGRRGGFIGAITGALLSNPKTKQAFKDLGTNLENMAKDIFGDVDVKGTLGNAVKTMSGLVGDGVNAANRLLTGQSDNVAKDIAGSLATLGGLALLVSPKSTIAGGKKTLTGLLKAFSKSGPIGKKVAGILALLGLTYMSPTGEVQGLDLEGGVAQGLGDIDPSKMSTDELRKMQEKRNENLALVNKDVGQAGLAVAGTAIAGSELAKQYAKNIKVKRPVRLTGNYGASNLDKGGGKTLENYKRLQKVLSFARGAGFGIITAALELPEVLDIINNKSLSDKQKAILMGPILGRTIGATGFAAFGSAVGLASPIPGGSIIGAGALGYLGYVSGDRAGRFLADFLLGGSPKLGPEEAKAAKAFMESDLRKAAMGQGKKQFGPSPNEFLDVNLANTNLKKQSDVLSPGSYKSLVDNLGNINTRVASEMGYNDRGNLKPIVVDASVKDNSVRTNSSSAFISGGTATNMQDQFSGGRVAAGT